MNEILYHTNYLDLKATTTSRGSQWVYAHRPNAKDVVVILPITDDEILFVIEKRPPIQAEQKGTYTIGLVAGLVGDERINETIEDAIQAELLEEAGLTAERFEIKAKKVASSPGCVSETCIIAKAYIRNKEIVKEPVDDGGIIVERVWVKKNEVHTWLAKKEKEGYVLTAHTLAALFYLYE